MADWLVDDSLDQELIISQKQEYDDKKDLLKTMKILNEETDIKEKALRKSSLKISKKYKISRERIRQIETKAFENYKNLIGASKSKNLLQLIDFKGSSIKIVSSLSGLVDILEILASIRSSIAKIYFFAFSGKSFIFLTP